MMRFKPFPALLIACLAAGGLASPARAASAAQNPALTVTVNLTPATVKAGQTATGSGSVTNNTGSRLRVTVTGTITLPNGQQVNRSRTVTIRPGKTVSLSRSITIDSSHPKGKYTLTVTASANGSASQASASLEVQ